LCTCCVGGTNIDRMIIVTELILLQPESQQDVKLYNILIVHLTYMGPCIVNVFF